MDALGCIRYLRSPDPPPAPRRPPRAPPDDHLFGGIRSHLRGSSSPGPNFLARFRPGSPPMSEDDVEVTSLDLKAILQTARVPDPLTNLLDGAYESIEDFA